MMKGVMVCELSIEDRTAIYGLVSRIDYLSNGDDYLRTALDELVDRCDARGNDRFELVRAAFFDVFRALKWKRYWCKDVVPAKDAINDVRVIYQQIFSVSLKIPFRYRIRSAVHVEHYISRSFKNGIASIILSAILSIVVPIVWHYYDCDARPIELALMSGGIWAILTTTRTQAIIDRVVCWAHSRWAWGSKYSEAKASVAKFGKDINSIDPIEKSRH